MYRQNWHTKKNAMNIYIIIIGIMLSITILLMVRKDKMHGPYSIWWLLIAISAIILSLFPKISDYIAGWVGIAYPPTIILVLAISLILLKMLSMDMERTKQERKIRRLTQKIAILEDRLDQNP